MLLFVFESGNSISSSSFEYWFQSMVCAIHFLLKFNQMYFLIHLPYALLLLYNSNKKHHFLFDLVHLCNWYVSILSLALSLSLFFFLSFFGFAHLVYVFISLSSCLALPCLACNMNTTQKSHFFDLCKINSHRHNAHLGCCFCVNFIENLYRFIKSYFLQFNKQQQLENR